MIFSPKDEVDDQKSELCTLKSKVEDLKEDANKKNEMIGVSVTEKWFVLEVMLMKQWGKHQCIHHLFKIERCDYFVDKDAQVLLCVMNKYT